MRLVTESPIDVPEGPYRFDRRLSDRWGASGSATAFVLDGEGFGSRHALQLVDASFEGIGVRSSQPLRPGTQVLIDRAEPGSIRRRGIVLRCHPTGDGYRVAIRFLRRMAA